MYRSTLTTTTAAAAAAGSRTLAAGCRPQDAGLLIARALFSTSATRAQGGNPRSPLQIFRDTFKKEWDKSQELQENIKTLQDASGKLGESEAYKKAREAYLRAQRGSTIVGKTLKKTGETVEHIATRAWDSELGKNTRKAASATAKKLDESFEPVQTDQDLQGGLRGHRRWRELPVRWVYHQRAKKAQA